MISDHVQPYPVELWHWGVMHRCGHLRTIDRQAIRLALLPRGEAQVTRRGIRFKGVLYTCERALQEHWYVRASLSPWKVEVAYDLRNTDAIYLLLDQERDFYVATITDSRFAYRDWFDVEDCLTRLSQAVQQQRGQEEQSRSDLRQEVQATLGYMSPLVYEQLGEISKERNV
ncbi:MAG TPA: Mu transposase C-terminal domain-containing protein [Ktedonosporobacter sp.]|nr:Mu transposase C-terminal domain-containing protein [Ktedonosporobacter sp.]